MIAAIRKQSSLKTKDQSGINMVDLMMWLVIAALLLAAALQGIGFYKKTALVYQLSSDASGAGQNILAAASGKGSVTDAIAQDGINATKTSKTDTILSKSVGNGGHFIVISSNPELPDFDVVYSSESKDGLKAGVNVIPKGAGLPGIMLPERGTPINNKCSDGQWKAEYFNNLDVSGTPIATLCESKIQYAWGLGNPQVDNINPDQFSVRWSTSFDAPATKLYNFQMQSDDGSRIKLDGVVIAGTFSITADSYSKQVTVNQGKHDLVVEYHENGGSAAAYFNYAPVS